MVGRNRRILRQGSCEEVLLRATAILRQGSCEEFVLRAVPATRFLRGVLQQGSCEENSSACDREVEAPCGRLLRPRVDVGTTSQS